MIKVNAKRTPANKKLTTTKVERSKTPAVSPSDFAPGQKWQLELGHAEVVHVGKVLIDFRYYRMPNQKRVGIETKTLREFAEALKKNKAKLMA